MSSRSFGPAGPTFFSFAGKEGKSAPEGRKTLSSGFSSPLDSPLFLNDQGGPTGPPLDPPFGKGSSVRTSPTHSPLRGIVRRRCPNGRAYSLRDVRTDEHTILGESKGAPKGPLWSEGRGAGEGAFELPPLLPALLLTFAAAGKSKSRPQARNSCPRLMPLDKSAPSCIIRI